MEDVILGKELADLKDEALEQVYSAVTGTMGPDGNYGVLAKGTRPKATKDGVSVAKAIKFHNPVKDLISQILTEASIKTDAICGDGTTTTVFLTYHIYDQFKTQFNGKGSFITKARLNALQTEALAKVNSQLVNVGVDDQLLRDLAMTTANNEVRVVDTILDIYGKSTGLPDIEVFKGVDSEDFVEYSNGIRFNGGYVHPNFSKDGNGGVINLKNCYGLIIDAPLKDYSDELFSEIINHILHSGEVDRSIPLVIVAKEYSPEWITAWATLANKAQFPIYPIRVQAIGSVGAGIIGDISTVFNHDPNKVFLDAKSWVDSGMELSSWENVQVGSQYLRISGNDLNHEIIAERIKNIENQIAQIPAELKFSAVANLLRRRISNLAGSQVTVVVGGETDSDIQERFDRYVDVNRAVKSALSNGVVPGIGYTLALAGQELKDKYPDDLIAQKYGDVLKLQLEHLLGVPYEVGMTFTNLATGATGSSPMEIGVWDALLATTTALKAGLATAIILGSNHAVVLGNRAGAVRSS